MTDKILQTSASTILANANTYGPKTVSIQTPNVVVGNSNANKITTSVEDINVKVNVDNMGEEYIPNPSLFKRAHDYYASTDILSVTIKPNKFDQLTGVTDLFNMVVNYRRVFQESQVTNDSYKVFRVFKGVLDTGYLTDLPRKSIVKPFVDQYSATDIRSVVYGKNVLDSVIMSEEVLKLAYKKLANETVISQDVLSRTVNYNRTFTEYVDATDDFYGSANIDDDQIANVGKSLVDWLASTDIRAVHLSIVKSDQAYATDQKAVVLSRVSLDNYTTSTELRNLTGKVALDAFLANDSNIKNTGKVLASTSNTQDVKSVDANKVLAHIASSSEQLKYTGFKYLNTQYSVQDNTSTVWSAYRNFASTANSTTELSFNASTVLLSSTTSSDLLNYNSTKVLSSEFTTTDLLSRTVDYSRTFTDYVDATDDFYGSANIDDDQIASIGKNTVDWAYVPDELNYSASKILSDQYLVPDVSYSSTYKVLQSYSTSSDTVDYSVYKTLVSAYTAQDTLSVDASKSLDSQTTSLDYFARQVSYYREYSDISYASEILSANAFKVSQDSIATADLVSTITNFNRNPVDSTSNFDVLSFVGKPQILDLAGVSTTLSVAGSKVLSDTFTKQDQIQKAPNKTVVDYAVSSDYVIFYLFTNRYFDEIISAADSGFINNQSYFAGSYIEPGYVGTNTYFS